MSTDIRNPLFARLWDCVLSRESRGMHDLRRELLAGLRGRVLEIGPGNGPSFALYPESVSQVVAVEPEPYLRERARQAASQASIPIHVVAGVADELPVPDEWADTVVCCLVLCSVPDQRRALAEIRRVLRPGGELRLFEHVGSHNAAAQALLRGAEVTFWARAFGNCHPTRHTLDAVQEAGFDTREVRRRGFAPAAPPLPMVIGVARA